MKLTTIQKIALYLMEEENLGAVLVAGFGFVFPVHVRQNVAVAEAVVARLSK